MPHAEGHEEFTPDQYPPFPDSPEFPTIELQTISLKRIQDNDSAEQDRMFEACKAWGFFYLELAGSEQGEMLRAGADEVCQAAEQVFRLPLEEKMEYSMRGQSLFGYKCVGQTVTDKQKTPDTAEFFNVGKNDALRRESPSEMTRTYPDVVHRHMALFERYSVTAHGVGMGIMDMLAARLGVDPEELRARHRLEEMAGDHVRLTRGPARKDAAMPEIQTPAHTDFGTITILMNWLGGLQVYGTPNHVLGNLSYDDDETNSWMWVRPKPGCAIVNLGDAAVKFTNGVLCSGRHRVVPAPGEQGKWPRYSVVYFVRPCDDCRLKTLKGRGIPEAGDEDEKGVNANEWIYLQSQRLRTGAYN